MLRMTRPAFSSLMVITALCFLFFAPQIFAAPAPAKPKPTGDEITRIIVECEDMKGVKSSPEIPWRANERMQPIDAKSPGGFPAAWTMGRWGRDLHQNMIFGGVWASRMATAICDASDTPSEVTQTIDVPKTAKYKVWAKYESTPLFQYPFSIKIEKLGRGMIREEAKETVFVQTYGLTDSPKHWCFTDKLRRGELYWAWGIDHDAAEGYETVLNEGRYRVTLAKASSPPGGAPVGARSVDVILITSDLREVSSPDFPRYPLLDELQKENHFYVRYRNTGPTPVVIEEGQWQHRYNHFYTGDPSKFPLVRFYDDAGAVMLDDKGKPLSNTKGFWDKPIAPGATSPWVDIGPKLTTETACPVWMRAIPVDKLPLKMDAVFITSPFELEIASEPSTKTVFKKLKPEPGSPMLAILAQPDIHRPEGKDWTMSIADIYRRVTKELDAIPRVGPVPKRIVLTGAGGYPTNPFINSPSPKEPDFAVAMDYLIGLGLNMTPYDPGAKTANLYEAAQAYYATKGVTMVERSGKYHHTQDPKVLVDAYPDDKSKSRMQYVSFGDEIGLPSIDLKDEKMLAAFREFLAANGVKAEDLGFASMDKAMPMTAFTADAAVGVGLVPAPADATKPKPALPVGPAGSKLRRLYWYSHLFHIDRGIKDFAEKTVQMKAHMGPVFATSANLGGMHPFYWVHQAAFIESFKGQAMTRGFSEDYDYCMPEPSREVIGFLAAYLRAGSKYHDTPMQFYNMPHWPGNSGDHLVQNAITLWGQGIRDLDFFCVSPDAWSTENFIHSRGGIETARAIRRISGMAGNIEDDLIPARVRQAKVAILLSEASDVWEIAGGGQWSIEPGSVATNVFQEERKNTWHALRRAGYLVDLITENDVAGGYLKNYQALYVIGRNIERRSVPTIKTWVEAGGALYVGASSARRDEVDDPFTGMDELVGRGAAVKTDEFRGPLRAKLELLFLKPIDEVTLANPSAESGKDAKARKFSALAWRETFKPADAGAVTIATYNDGSPAAIRKSVGKGTGYYVAAMPGQAYVRAGLPLRPMGKGGPEFNSTNFEPVNFDANASSLIVTPLTERGPKPDFSANKRNIICSVLDAPTATVITVINLALQHDGDAKGVEIRLAACRPVKSAYTATKAEKVTAESTADGGAVIKLPVLREGDVIVIKH